MRRGVPLNSAEGRRLVARGPAWLIVAFIGLSFVAWMVWGAVEIWQAIL